MTRLGCVKKSLSCDLGMLCKAMGLQIGTRAKGRQLGFSVGQRVASCCSAEAVGREPDTWKLVTLATAWAESAPSLQWSLLRVLLGHRAVTECFGERGEETAVTGILGSTTAESGPRHPGLSAALAGVSPLLGPWRSESAVAGSWTESVQGFRQLMVLTMCLVKRNDLNWEFNPGNGSQGNKVTEHLGLWQGLPNMLSTKLHHSACISWSLHFY